MQHDQLSDWLSPLVANLSAARRKLLLRQIATELRSVNQQRIKQQQDPEGAPYTPRASNTTKVPLRQKRGPMFSKIRAAKYFTLTASPNDASLGFSGRTSIIARQHQEGGIDRSNKYPIHLPIRQLIGFSQHDEDRVLEMVATHLSQY